MCCYDVAAVLLCVCLVCCCCFLCFVPFVSFFSFRFFFSFQRVHHLPLESQLVESGAVPPPPAGKSTDGRAPPPTSPPCSVGEVPLPTPTPPHSPTWPSRARLGCQRHRPPGVFSCIDEMQADSLQKRDESCVCARVLRALAAWSMQEQPVSRVLLHVWCSVIALRLLLECSGN